MKKATIILLLLTSIVNSQNIEIGILQDTRLAFFKDNSGNSPFTTDIILNTSLNCKEFDLFEDVEAYFSINAEFEYADLKGGKFKKYLISPTITFTDIHTPKIFFIPRLDYTGMEISIGYGYGFLERGRFSYQTHGLTLDVSWRLEDLNIRIKNKPVNLKGLKSFFRIQNIRRPDLINMYGVKGDKNKTSVYFGFEYRIL